MISAHVLPLPVKPALQAQVKEPGVLVQVALTLHVLVAPAVLHSLISVHVVPSPLKPALQEAQVKEPGVLVQVGHWHCKCW